LIQIKKQQIEGNLCVNYLVCAQTMLTFASSKDK